MGHLARMQTLPYLIMWWPFNRRPLNTCSTIVLSEKICQTLKTVFDHISECHNVCKKYAAVWVIFSILFSVFGKCGQTRSFVFDILHRIRCCFHFLKYDYFSITADEYALLRELMREMGIK